MIQDEDGAQLCGVNPAAMRTLIFAVSGALAGLVAVTRSMTVADRPAHGIDFTMLALIVAVVGGLGSVSGAFLAGVLLGIVNTVSSYYIGSYVTTIVLLLRRGDHDRGPSARLARAAGMTAATPRPRARTRRASVVLRAYIPIVVTAALLALLPLRYSDSRTMMGVITAGMLFAAYVVAFNVIFGSTGQLFLCVGALAGVGGYTSAIFTDRVGMPMVLSMALVGVGAAVIGGLLSWIAVSRSLDVIFIGIVTLAFSLSFDNLLLGQRDLTGGETGLVVDAGSRHVPRRAGARRTTCSSPSCSSTSCVYRLLQRSHIGWAFRALRDDEVAAELAGVDVTRYRVFAGVIGSAMLGLAGARVRPQRGVDRPHHVRLRPRRRARARDARVRRDRQPARPGRRRGDVHDARRVAGVVQRDASGDLRRRDHRAVPRLPARRRPHRAVVARPPPRRRRSKGKIGAIHVGANCFRRPTNLPDGRGILSDEHRVLERSEVAENGPVDQLGVRQRGDEAGDQAGRGWGLPRRDPRHGNRRLTAVTFDVCSFDSDSNVRASSSGDRPAGRIRRGDR